MGIKKFIYFLVLLFISAALYGADNHNIEIEKISDYKGFKGEWIENKNSEKVENFIKIFGSGFKEIIDLNGKDYSKKTKVFVPYSDAYIEYLKSRENAPVSKNDFIWPIEKFDRIISTFGRRWSLFHEGIDIPGARGLPIIAVCNGRVVSAKFIDHLGNTICIEHRDNIFTRYAHASQILVKEGEIVKKGQVIGLVGSTGNSTGNHLHFEVRYGDFPLNPLDFLPFHPNVKRTQYIKKPD